MRITPRTVLFWPDTHYPFEDKRAVALVRKIIRKAKPDLVVCLGDWGDLYNASRHRPRPGGPTTTLREERDAARRGWRQLEDVCQQLWFCVGNHDMRVSSKVLEDLPAFYEVTPTIEEFYGLSDAVQVFQYQELARIGKMVVTHDLGKSGANATRDSLSSAQYNVVFGHSHRLEITYSGSLLEDRHFSMSCGWLGDVNNPAFHYAPASTRRVWQLGFGWARFEDGLVFATPVPIVNYTATVEGRVYRG